MTCRSRPILGLVCLLAPGAVSAGDLPYGLRLVRDERVRVEVRVVAPVHPGRPPAGGALDVPSTGPASLVLDPGWPTAGSASRLELRVGRLPPLPGAAHRLELAAELAGGEQVPLRARREMLFDEETTVLFEVARAGDVPLTLAVTAEASSEQALSAEVPAGPPVRLLLEIQWVEQGQAVSLETNQLDTLVGQAVSYAFRLGDPGAERAAQLRLFPALLVGGVLQIEIEINATMPGPDGRVQATSRRERWLSSAGTTSTLSLAAGEPARGFRFQVTPRF